MIEETRQVYQFDEFRLDVRKRQLLREGEVVPLYSKAFDLLLLLVRHSGRDLSKEELMESLWPDQFVEESNLSVNLSTVRKALGEKAARPRFLVTIPGRGYRFVGNVTLLDRDEGLMIESRTISQITFEQEVDDTNDTLATGTQKALPEAHVSIGVRFINALRHHPLVAFGLTIVIVAGVVGVIYYLRARKTEGAIESIAVLPFTNASGDPNADYLSDGVTESIINSFSQLPHLRVIPRSTVFRYKGQQIDPEEIGHKLSVRAVLTGRVQQRGDTINIQTELIDVDRNSQLWGDQFTLKLDELQAVQAKISDQILGQLRLRVSERDRQQLYKHTPPPEAYQAYMKGRYFLNLDTLEGCQKAIDYFNQAISQDQNYALAYASLSVTYTQMSDRWTPPRQTMTKAKDATLRALALDGSQAAAHLSLAKVLWWGDWDFPAAEKEFRRALELNPNDPDNYTAYGLFLGGTMERRDEGWAMENRALQLDPFSPITHSYILSFYYYTRQADRLIEEANNLLALNQNPAAAHGRLVDAYFIKGQYDRALQEMEKAEDLTARRWRGTFGYLYAASGRRKEALEMAAEFKKRSEHEYLSPYSLAIIYVGLGDNDRAFELLDQAIADHADDMTFIKSDVKFDKLHSDPRFADLLKRVGLSP